VLAASGKTVRMLLQSLVLSVGAWLVIHGEASGGVIFASSILSSRALAPLEQVIGNWRGLVGARQSWARLKQFMARLSEEAARQPLPAPRTALAIESLSLSPPGANVATVRDVSVLIYAGESVAVLGPSGCGKSTLIRGIAGIIDPRSGSVRLDGATLEQWPRRELGRHIGYLPQNVDLIAGTIAQNIARFDPEGAPEQVIAAAEQAGVHDMIQHLPDGYNTNVGPEGRRLSAGQRQRVALARALYGDPFLILLDEPNSNLDAEGETALVRAIESAKERRAIVITVAHRPAVLEAVDLVLLMRDGQATAYGRKERVVPHLLTNSSAPPILAAGKVS
jgi:ATP-binding cassette subfamily C protein